ncbi:MAG: ATP-binding protein [Spirochaetota bacterium]
MDRPNDWDQMRNRIIGLGEQSSRKSYYPELQSKIAQLEQAQEKLRISEKNLRTVFNSVHDAILIHDAAGKIIEVNDPMLALYGVSREQAFSFTVLDCSPADCDKKAVYDYMERALNGEHVLFEWKLRRPLDGEVRDVEVALNSFVWYDQKLIIASVRDITERIRLEEMLRQAQKMEAVGQLAGGIAHDFNNVLGGIIGFADLLLSVLPSGDPAHDYADKIIEASTRAAALTRQLLDFSRKGKQGDTFVRIGAIVSATLGILQRSIDPRITVRTEFHAPDETVKGDAGQIQNALLNLCLNARDAMPEGGTLTIETRNIVIDRPVISGAFELMPGEYVEISISDTGTGISPEVKSRIFDPFYTTKEVGKGTGLGLSMVYGCMRNHLGAVTVESEKGVGSVFRMIFPSADESAAQKGGVPETVKGKGEKILVVDDEANLREIAAQMLTNIGYTVVTATDGEDALRVFSEDSGSWDLVILDAIMPKMNGTETMIRIRELNPFAKIIFCSGYSSQQSEEDFRRDNIPFIRKPYRIQELAEIIHSILSRKE